MAINREIIQRIVNQRTSAQDAWLAVRYHTASELERDLWKIIRLYPGITTAMLTQVWNEAHSEEQWFGVSRVSRMCARLEEVGLTRRRLCLRDEGKFYRHYSCE